MKRLFLLLALANFAVPASPQALTQVERERAMSEEELRKLVAKHTQGRQLGFLGEPRVNVLELNLDLDASNSLAR